ncbi:MAG TPA: LCP family protein [Pseudonocardia sp.]
MRPVDDERAPRQTADAIAPPMRPPAAPRRPRDPGWQHDSGRYEATPQAQDSGRHVEVGRAAQPPRSGQERGAAAQQQHRPLTGRPLSRPVPNEPDGPPTVVHDVVETGSRRPHRPGGARAAVATPTADRVRQSPPSTLPPSTLPPGRVRQSPPSPAAPSRSAPGWPAPSQSAPSQSAPSQSAPGRSALSPSAPTRSALSPSAPTRSAPPNGSSGGRRSASHRDKGPTVTRHRPRTLGSALGATLASAVIPGTGLLMIRRRRAGGLVLGVFLLVIAALSIAAFTVRRNALVQNLLSSRVLLLVMAALIVAGLAWITQIARTYALARPRGLDTGRRVTGVLVVTMLCLLVATPFGFAANLVNSQRTLLNNLFSGGGGTSVAEAITKPRLNVLLVGSDAGPDRTGARTDTMMMASIDTATARTTLFALPRNIGYAQFPPGTPMAEQFPKGFHDPADPLSGNYLLNAVYAWGLDHPRMAPTTPTDNPGLNLLHQSVAYMLGIDIDYYVEVNMAGFASIINAVGGVTVDVGPTPLPIGGVLPDGRHVKPSGYVPAGVQHLDGDQALWFARSRRDSDDYNRMGRQRCLLQSLLQQKSPTDVISHFQAISAATTNSVSTNVPQEVLGSLVALAGSKPLSLQSIAFDPNLPDPNETDGHFNPSHVDVSYMREVVQNAFVTPEPAKPTPTTAPTTPSTRSAAPTTGAAATAAVPSSLACG